MLLSPMWYAGEQQGACQPTGCCQGALGTTGVWDCNVEQFVIDLRAYSVVAYFCQEDL